MLFAPSPKTHCFLHTLKMEDCPGSSHSVDQWWPHRGKSLEDTGLVREDALFNSELVLHCDGTFGDLEGDRSHRKSESSLGRRLPAALPSGVNCLEQSSLHKEEWVGRLDARSCFQRTKCSRGGGRHIQD